MALVDACEADETSLYATKKEPTSFLPKLQNGFIFNIIFPVLYKELNYPCLLAKEIRIESWHIPWKDSLIDTEKIDKIAKTNVYEINTHIISNWSSDNLCIRSYTNDTDNKVAVRTNIVATVKSWKG